jgi:ubiquinone/menaquinone biosynthesis C-methylase UbiE
LHDSLQRSKPPTPPIPPLLQPPSSYDSDLSYHGPLAEALLARAAPAAGERVLDLACGTGLVALAAAAAVGSSGRVVGVDLSGGMLQQASLCAR